jgi:hypothetical protein
MRLLIFCFIIGVASLPVSAQQPAADNVVYVTLDGMRWQEVFNGASLEYMGDSAGGGWAADSAGLAARFWRPTAEARRSLLMPFLWNTVVANGQIIGNPTRHSDAHVTNGLWFSYPGYSEMLTGAADPRIDSNDSIPNPNITVLEYLNGLPGFRGKVAAFGSWEILPFIVNARRSGIYTNGDGPPVREPASARDSALNDLAAELPPLWGSTRLDGPTMLGALEYVKAHKPRVLYVMLGETDEWAHDQRYDLYLDAAWRGDRFIQRLWELLQTMPEYAGKTALVISTDHGRGDTPNDWGNHGKEYPQAGRIWIAAMGPGVSARGDREGQVATQSQIAATLARLLGQDFRANHPRAAPPLDFWD